MVDHPGGSSGQEADALVTATAGCTLMVRTADCAPVVLVGDHAVGVVHAGWQGLLAGVVGEAVAALQSLDPGPLVAHLGPCIRPGCYEFTGPQRDEMAQRFGPALAARTTWGTPALDLPAGVRAALAEAGVTAVHDDAPCTACDTRWFSHRARGEAGRFATVAWLAPA